MNDYIDIYCERLEPGLWAEPLNAVSNLAFIVAGFFAFRLLKSMHSENAKDPKSSLGRGSLWSAYTLITLIFAMGIGSGLFHSFAVTWAMLLDVLPILAFQIVFIVVYAQRVIGLKCLYTLPLLGVFFALMWGSMQLPREFLNGTMEYAPALIFVTGFGLWHLKHAARERWGLLLAAGVFAVSMTLRSVDMQLCAAFPVGTHFMWHILNAVVLYLSTRAFILNVK